jgi:AcrR family transcriptional regulator
MPEPRRVRLPATERRGTILEAGGRLFGACGYEATTVDDIAAAAGVTKPIVYRHFGSKAGLYLAILERHRYDLPGFAAEEGLSGAGSARSGAIEIETLRTILSNWLEYVESHSYAWRMLFWDTGGGAEIEEFRRVVSAEAREVLAVLIRTYSRDPIAPEEVEPLAELMRSGMASLVLWWVEHQSTPREAILVSLTRVWSGLL